MKSSNQRETVTLFEGARTITEKPHNIPPRNSHFKNTTSNTTTSNTTSKTTSSSSHYLGGAITSSTSSSDNPLYGVYGLSTSNDETLVVLDRLKEVTKQAQQLEVRV